MEGKIYSPSGNFAERAKLGYYTVSKKDTTQPPLVILTIIVQFQ